MRYFSLFSGIGGFELGIQKVSPKAICVGFSEIDKYAIRIYRRHFNGHKNYGDATKIDKLPDFDLLVGGFPCQSFSVAGKGKGFQDVRGTLFFEIARILSYKRPRYIFIENVRGLLSNQSGETFQKIIEVLTNLGYILQWEVLNSKNYGVPQNRERVFIIGHLRGEPRPEVFPIGEGTSTVQENKLKFSSGLTKTKKWLDDGKNLSRNFSQGERIYSEEGISPTLNAQSGGTAGVGNALIQTGVNCTSRGFEQRTDNLACTIKAGESGTKNLIQIGDIGYKTKVWKGGDGRLHTPDMISQCLEAGTSGGGGTSNRPLIVSKSVRVGGRKSPHGSKQNWDSYEVNGGIRRLTPLECERLQGFPDNWTKYGKRSLISDTQRYKVLGNAVTVTVVEAIFLKFINSIGT